MFNKKWSKVLLSQTAVIVVSLGVFFLELNAYGIGKESPYLTTLIIVTWVFFLSLIYASCILNIFSLIFSMASVTAVIAVLAVGAVGIFFTIIVYASVSTIVVFLFFALIFFLVVVGIAIGYIITIAEKYRLPKLWLGLSYLAEALIIFFPILFINQK